MNAFIEERRGLSTAPFFKNDSQSEGAVPDPATRRVAKETMVDDGIYCSTKFQNREEKAYRLLLAFHLFATNLLAIKFNNVCPVCVLLGITFKAH